MPTSDAVRLRHIVDAARQAVAFVRACPRLMAQRCAKAKRCGEPCRREGEETV